MKCDHCPGKCPENCRSCIYQHCTKEVDEKLVDYHYRNYINHIDLEDENNYWYKFVDWFKVYFQIKEEK